MKILIVALFVVAMMALTTAHGADRDWIPYCPPGWTKFDVECLRYVPEKMTWAEAKNNCLSMEGRLVAVYDVFRSYCMGGINKVLQSAGHENGQVWIQDCNEKSVNEIMKPDGGTEPSCLQIGKGSGGGSGGGGPMRRGRRSYPFGMRPKRVPECFTNPQCEAHLPSVCSKLFY